MNTAAAQLPTLSNQDAPVLDCTDSADRASPVLDAIIPDNPNMPMICARLSPSLWMSRISLKSTRILLPIFCVVCPYGGENGWYRCKPADGAGGLP